MRNKYSISAFLLLLFFITLFTPVYARQPVKPGTPPPKPADYMQGLIGRYVRGNKEILVLEKNAVLYIMTPDKKLHYIVKDKDNVDLFKVYRRTIFGSKTVKFTRTKNGRSATCLFGKKVFKRKLYGTEMGKPFRIKPLYSPEKLRKIALKAKAPYQGAGYRKPELVDVTKLDPTIRLDIRYATKDNFMGIPLYSKACAFMQKPAAEALARASKKLRKKGYGLIVFDAYRPWYVTKMFWDATPEHQKHFVANPRSGSRHNRGTAVDLTLYNLKSGEQVKMTGGFDEFTNRSYSDFPGGTSLERWYRELLIKTMESEGFTVYNYEWWHFDYKDWKKYPIMNKDFDKIK